VEQQKPITYREQEKPFAYTIKQSCALSGLGRTTLWSKISDGSLESVTVGRRRLIKGQSLRRLLGAE
jgi:excisionase family DNA binding protein